MDHKRLLEWYVDYVSSIEGTSFLHNLSPADGVTEDEIAELYRIRDAVYSREAERQ